ncbi:SIS domain-containing protein [Jiella pacifica]|uniref:SIS domain-containing protein n=1 Tax=Jiella pacifica TaxID=2696469 RepID=A0A6N9SZ51_9HYPH|nr:SIS domain-containing protein [Jiella pacifica]NDW04091.1 SIS domain-containing protein [Jiella pacifica]
MSDLYRTALAELGTVMDGIDDAAVDEACRMIASARRIGTYAGGREGLQIKGFAMRLFHLGAHVGVVGDMTMPALGNGDLFVVSVGPGEISTALALMGVAKKDGAKILFITAQPGGRGAQLADFVLTVPAQTMANDQGGAATSVLPMGSLYEGALFVLFEVMVLKLRDLMAVSPETMRSNHTNME